MWSRSNGGSPLAYEHAIILTLIADVGNSRILRFLIRSIGNGSTKRWPLELLFSVNILLLALALRILHRARLLAQSAPHLTCEENRPHKTDRGSCCDASAGRAAWVLTGWGGFAVL